MTKPRTMAFFRLALLAAVVGPGSPGAAQCLLCSVPDGAITPASGAGSETPEDRPLRVDITANLDFSRLVAGGQGGSLTIDPAAGGARAQGDVAAIGGLGFSGRVLVEGAPGRLVRIDMPVQIVMTSPTGGTAMVRDIVTNLPPLARLGPDGRLEFAFGGRLEVSGGADGDYRGRVPIEVNYE